MTEPQTIFDDVDEAVEQAAMAGANAQIDAGQGVPHDVVGVWLQRLAKGERAAPTFLDD
jgi:hypothetical protein